jgi:type II secretory ATPase GspE/PulE/Tfp pilus assembly ATPase PilB-like protein
MCPDHSAVASAVGLILNQRLIRKVCTHCEGTGCEACLHTGYNGRMPLMEWLRADETVRGHIRRREPAAITGGQTLETAARLLVNQGLTNETEYKRIFGL